MPAELFVDTSGWYALTVSNAPSHRTVANALVERIRAGDRVVTTNLVVAETHALLLRRAGHRSALTFVERVGLPPNQIIASNTELEEQAARDWLRPYQDQDFSFTDAVSFAVMRSRKIRHVLALDHHFAVAGFVVLP